MVEKDNKHDEPEVVMDEEFVSEDTEIEEEEGSMKDTLATLRKKLKASEEDRKALQDELQRTRADFLNSRRRLEEQLERDRERAVDKILIELLTLYDSFDSAMADTATWESVDKKWRLGVEAMHSKLLSILNAKNVLPTNPIGQAFNPEEHEAVSNQEVTDDAHVDMVLSVLQKGFKRGDTIIRPARVVVGTK